MAEPRVNAPVGTQYAPVTTDAGADAKPVRVIANPLSGGTGEVTYFSDKTIDFEVGGALWNMGEDGRAFRYVGNDEWKEVTRIPPEVASAFAALVAHGKKLDEAAAGGPKPQPGSDTSTTTPTTDPTTTTPGTGDVIDTKPTQPNDKMAAIEQRLEALERENRELGEYKKQAEEARAAEAAKETEEAKKPSFYRALLEIIEGLARWFMPIVNLASACVRVLKVCYKLIKGEQIDWKKEGLRMLGDVAGVFFPPAGAIANTAFNLWWDESQMLGGLNEVFDKAEVHNSLRYGATKAWEGISGFFGDIGKRISGNSPKAGAADDDGVTPLATVAPEEIGT